MPDPSSLRTLVAECLERIEDEGPAVVERLCREHPAHAEGLRRRLAVLAGAGLLGDAPVVATLPERLGGYRLGDRLGGGGMGEVYEAVHEELGRVVALKLVRPETLPFAGARERFRREVAAIARIEHPGVVAILDVGEEHGLPWLAMERVRGRTLAELLVALTGRDPRVLVGRDLHAALGAEPGDEPAPPDAPWETVVLELSRQAAIALEHCHRHGVVHRDVKPSNLMLRTDGRLQLLDFGVAATEGATRLTRSGTAPGSVPYMAPERLRGEPGASDARGDVYALGVTLYELLTLRHPFEAATDEAVRRRVLEALPARLRTLNPALSRDAEAVCLKAMDPEPGRRYASAAALAADLRAVLERRPVAARPPSSARDLWRWARRHPALVVALLAAIGMPAALAWQERVALRRVDAERAVAQRDLGAALSAVDAMLLRVGDVALADVPELETVRAALLDDARRLLDELGDRHSGDSDLLRLSARARQRAGALANLLGRTVEAEQAFRASEQLFAALPDAALALAGARIERAELLIADPSRGDDAAAALDDAERGLAALPEDPARLRAQAQAGQARGMLLAQAGRADEAEVAFAAAIVHGRRALAISPDDRAARVQLASALGERGKRRLLVGRADEALADAQEAVALFEAARADEPASTDLRLRLGLARSSLGNAQYVLGDAAAAAAEVEQAAALFADLARDHPAVPRFRLEHAGMLQARSVLEPDADRRIALTRQALGIMERVADESPLQVDLATNVAGAHANLALQLLLASRADEALDEVERTADSLARMAAVNAGDPMLERLCEHALATLGMLADAGHGAQAGTLARSLLETLRQAGVPGAARLAAEPRHATLLAQPPGAGSTP